jgi:hypothetical protein
MSQGQRPQYREDEELRSGNGPVVRPVRSPSTQVQINHHDEPLQSQESKFLHVTSDFKPVDMVSRQLIRSHVMRNYGQEKNKKTNSLTSPTSVEVVSARDKLKGRWRLGAGEPIGGQQATTWPKSKGKMASSSRRSSQQSTKDEIVLELKDVHDSPSNRMTQLVTKNVVSILPRFSIEQFQCHQVDPFKAAPVNTSNRTNRLFHFCK